MNKIIIIIQTGSLVSMSCSRLSMVSNSLVFLKTMTAKQTNTMILPEVAPIHPTYSIKSLTIRKVYTNCETMMHPKNKKPTSSLSLNGYSWAHRFDELIPRIAYFLWIVWKIFILIGERSEGKSRLLEYSFVRKITKISHKFPTDYSQILWKLELIEIQAAQFCYYFVLSWWSNTANFIANLQCILYLLQFSRKEIVFFYCLCVYLNKHCFFPSNNNLRLKNQFWLIK